MATAAATKTREQTGDEEIQDEEDFESEGEEYDPEDEAETYCICNSVSHGTMIACDNDQCGKAWFHIGCVGLEDMPGRRDKWYCPECREELSLGQSTNGVVAHGA